MDLRNPASEPVFQGCHGDWLNDSLPAGKPGRGHVSGAGPRHNFERGWGVQRTLIKLASLIQLAALRSSAKIDERALSGREPRIARW